MKVREISVWNNNKRNRISWQRSKRHRFWSSWCPFQTRRASSARKCCRKPDRTCDTFSVFVLFLLVLGSMGRRGEKRKKKEEGTLGRLRWWKGWLHLVQLLCEFRDSEGELTLSCSGDPKPIMLLRLAVFGRGLVGEAGPDDCDLGEAWTLTDELDDLSSESGTSVIVLEVDVKIGAVGTMFVLSLVPAITTLVTWKLSASATLW